MLSLAKLSHNGGGQAVRLPAEDRCEGSEVRDPRTEDVIPSKRTESWRDFFELAKALDIPNDFLADRDDGPPQRRKPL